MEPGDCTSVCSNQINAFPSGCTGQLEAFIACRESLTGDAMCTIMPNPCASQWDAAVACATAGADSARPDAAP